MIRGLIIHIMCLACMVGISNAQKRNFYGDNIKLLYSFENNLTDSTVNKNDGSGINEVFYSQGRKGKALDISNGNTYVQIPANIITISNDTSNRSFSFTAWIYYGYGSSQQNSVSEKIPELDRQRTLLFLSDDATVRSNIGGKNTSAAMPSGYLNSWVHIAVVLIDSEVDSCKIYINGEIKADSAVANGILPHDGSYIIGYQGDGLPSNDWIGKMDELAIYNRNLTNSEVSEIFNEQSVIIKERKAILDNLNAYSANGIVSLSSEKSLTGRLMVTDMLGKLIFDRHIEGHTSFMINKQFEPGIYIVHLLDGEILRKTKVFVN